MVKELGKNRENCKLVPNILDRMFGRFLNHATIFVYHRVANVSHDPHLLCVSLKNFENQIKYLKENFDVVPLSQIINNLKSHKIKNKTISITFDDGYADNFYNALPILEKFNVCATIFVTTGNIDSQENFYWDKDTNKEDRGRSMTKKEIGKISAHNLIEIGAHTVNHPNLKKIYLNKQTLEIDTSKKALENILGKKIDGFAYPFGSKNTFSKETIKAVKQVGFRYACANTQKRIYSFSNVFAIPRILLRDWDTDILKEKFKNF